MSTATATPTGGSRGGAQPGVPFLAGTYEYTEPMFTDTVTPGANSVENIHNITPGGFLRGIYLEVTSAGGSLGTGVLNPDNPWSVFSNASVESIDGTPILYPMSGYQMYLVARYTRPWDGDPAADASYNQGINPSFRIRLFVESRMSLGALPNTDARAQYRIRYTVNAFNPGIVTTTGSATAPVVTIKGYLEIYAQPPAADLAGNPIAQIPDGVAVQRFVSRQAGIATVPGTMTIQTNRVGNLQRVIILEFRDNTAAYPLRVELTADPFRWRLDNTQLASYTRSRLDYWHDIFYAASPAMSTRPTGVYVLPRWHNPGEMDGMYWLPTTEASYETFEINGAPTGGQLAIITEDLAPIGPVPSYLMGI